MLRTWSLTAAVAVLWWGSEAFLPSPTFSTSRDRTMADSSTSLFAEPRNKLTQAQKLRRKELISRSGSFFQLDRLKGYVEFGSSAKLFTQLDNEANPEGIATWLSDGRGLALSIWDEKMMEDLGDSVYRLQTMKLHFVTIQCSPSVDVQMWTQPDPKTGEPVFLLQSIDFNPNIQVLPGVGISAASLGVQIDVVGQLRPSKDGKGVTGFICFATTGNLPPPLRILPQGLLKMASDSINDTVVSFAVESFRKGAIQQYQKFCAAEKVKDAKLQEQQAEIWGTSTSTSTGSL